MENCLGDIDLEDGTCPDFKCNGPSSCSNRGNCTSNKKSCECEEGFSGLDCSVDLQGEMKHYFHLCLHQPKQNSPLLHSLEHKKQKTLYFKRVKHTFKRASKLWLMKWRSLKEMIRILFAHNPSSTDLMRHYRASKTSFLDLQVWHLAISQILELNGYMLSS